VLDLATFHFVKSKLPEKDHALWEMDWARNKNDKLIVGLKEKLVDIMEDLDNGTGGHGHKGAAWMDKKCEELKSHFYRLT
jgi:hypothetical protein